MSSFVILRVPGPLPFFRISGLLTTESGANAGLLVQWRIGVRRTWVAWSAKSIQYTPFGPDLRVESTISIAMTARKMRGGADGHNARLLPGIRLRAGGHESWSFFAKAAGGGTTTTFEHEWPAMVDCGLDLGTFADGVGSRTCSVRRGAVSGLNSRRRWGFHVVGYEGCRSNATKRAQLIQIDPPPLGAGRRRNKSGCGWGLRCAVVSVGGGIA